MSDLNQKICVLGQKRELEELGELIKNTEVDELISLCKNKIKGGNFTCTWNYLLQAFTGSPASHQKRFHVTKTVLKEIEDGEVSGSSVNSLIQRLCLELNKFKSEHLADLCNLCLNSIQSKDSTHMSWKDLLPELLNVLTERNSFEYEDIEYSGSEYKTNFINNLCISTWSPNTVTSLTSMFIDMPLTKDEHQKVVNKLGQYIDKLTPQEIPAFVYQILRLCQNNSVRSIFLRLQHYFGLRIYDQAKDEAESNSESLGFDGIESASNQELIEAESTVLYHIHNSASNGHTCIKDYLNSLKNLQKVPEFILHPFQLMLLFTVSTINYYEDTIFEILRHSIVKSYQEEIKKSSSSWFKDMIPINCKMEEVLNKVINFSLHDRELTVKALVNFGFVLLGVGSALGRDIMAEKQWTIGNMILLKIIKRKRNFAPAIIQMLGNHIVTGHNVTQYIECLYILSRSYPLLMIENQSCVVELMESLVQMPGSCASQLLDAIIPLTKVSPTIRDHLILLLRKALYSRSAETRSMAVGGFLQLMSQLKISNLSALSQSSNCSGSFTSGHSLFTQLSLNRSSQCAPSIFSNEAVCLEVLSILKRCFMQQFEVKAKLYEGLYDAVCLNCELGVPVLDVMLPHFQIFYDHDENNLPPIKFKEVVVIRDVDAVLQEPLGKLIYAMSLIVTKVAETEEENITVIKLRSILDSLCRRMAQSELVHFQLDDGTDLLDILPESQKKVCVLKEAMCVYEALIAYKILSWTRNSDNNGQQINNLYQGYSRLVQFAKGLSKPKKDNRKKKVDETSTSVVASQKKDKELKNKNIKLPDTVWDYNTILRLLKTLHETDVSWISPGKATSIKTKREFHQHVMQATLQIVQSVKNIKDIDSNRHKVHYENLLEIAKILYKRIITRLNEFVDFDCTTGILAMDCFQSILMIIAGNFKGNFESFIAKLNQNVNDGEDTIPKTVYLSQTIEVYQKLFEIDEEETSSDPEIKKLSNVVINTLSVLAGQLTTRNVNLVSELYEWLRQYAYSHTLSNKVSVSFANLFFDTHIKSKVSLTLLESVSSYIGDVIGVITEEQHETEKFDFINEATVHNVLLSLSNCIKSELENIESIIGRLKSEYYLITYPGEDNIEKKKECLKNRERGVCCQLCFIVTILTNMNNISLAPGHLSEAVFKNVMQLFCTLSSLTKYFMMRSSKANAAFQGARFERLVKLAGKQLSPVVYKFILYIEEAQKQITEKNQNKKKTVDSSTLKSKVLRETRMIPKMVYEMEQFSKCITQLSNKTKVDLAKYVGSGVVRDFRILKLKEVLENVGDNSFVTTQHTEMNTTHNQDDTQAESDKENESDAESSPPPTKKSKV